MQNQNWLQLAFLVVVLGFSFLSWLYRKLNEQAAKKRAKDLIEARQREMLRTGRDPGSISVEITQEEPETQRQREIAARREAQLAELRRRAQIRQQGASPQAPSPAPAPPKAPPITRIPGSMGPTVPQRRAQTPPPRPAKQAKQRPQKQAVRPVAAPVEEEETTHRLVPEVETATARRPSPIVSAAAPQTPEEWRRAIIANEILSPPVAVRKQDVPVPF